MVAGHSAGECGHAFTGLLEVQLLSSSHHKQAETCQVRCWLRRHEGV